MEKSDIILALTPVVDTFEMLDTSYYIGGSIASSFHGVARATLDVDIVADIKMGVVRQLTDILSDKYYIDETMVKEAVRDRSSFNLIHLETMIKIDVFIQKNEPYYIEVKNRKKSDTFEGRNDKEYYFASPEDIIINKLLWYEMGGRVSERQMKDVIGVLKVQSSALDTDYLKKWSKQLAVYDLLEIACHDAGENLV